MIPNSGRMAARRRVLLRPEHCQCLCCLLRPALFIPLPSSSSNAPSSPRRAADHLLLPMHCPRAATSHLAVHSRVSYLGGPASGAGSHGKLPWVRPVRAPV
ncbi:hypothetical protein VPH35_020338 [Triticum aestivum]